MKVLTLIQPWGTLIALGEKKIETRSWKTNYRGPLFIHAGKKIDWDICQNYPFKDVLSDHGITLKSQLPTGMIIAKCELVDCIKMSDWGIDTSLRVISATLEDRQIVKGNELEFGDYAPGRYAWILDNIELLKEPIPAKGQLGLWEYKE